MKPKGMPPYPDQRRQALDLLARKDKVLTNMMFMEKALIGGNFHYFASMLKARKELKEINNQISVATRNYGKSVRI